MPHAKSAAYAGLPFETDRASSTTFAGSQIARLRSAERPHGRGRVRAALNVEVADLLPKGVPVSTAILGPGRWRCRRQSGGYGGRAAHAVANEDPRRQRSRERAAAEPDQRTRLPSNP